MKKVWLIAFALIVVWWIRRGHRRADADTWLPPELQTAKLAYAERLFRTDGPIRISARVDRVYRDRAGRLTLVELKTRGRDAVYASDVIELSAQRAAVIATTGETVSAHAYVLVRGTGGQGGRTHRVDLLTEGPGHGAGRTPASAVVGGTAGTSHVYPGPL